MKLSFLALRLYVARGAMAFGSMLVALILLEAAARAFCAPIVLSYEWLLKDRRYIPDPDVIFTRSDIPQKFGETGKRIAVVGDSHSDCDVWDFPCYPGLLRQSLREAGNDVRIEDFAVSGRNADEEYRVLTTQVFPSKPDAIIWQLYVNDVRENLLFPLYTVSPQSHLVALDAKNSWAYKRQRFYAAVPWAYALRSTMLFRSILRVFEKDLAMDIYGRDEKQKLNASIQRIALQLHDINDKSERENIPVMFVLIPPQSLGLVGIGSELTDQSVYNNEMYRSLDRVLSDFSGYIPMDGIGMSTEASHILGVATTSGVSQDSYYLDREDISLVGDKHLNERGNQRVADSIRDRIHW